MLWVLVALGSMQVAEILFCGFNIMTLFSLIPRIMFTARIAGTVFKASTLAILEFVAVGLWLIWRAAILRKFTWMGFLVILACAIISSIIYVVDTESYVYIVEDD